MKSLDPELEGWESIEELSRRGSSTSSTEAQVQLAKKLSFAIANLRQAVNDHQKITGDRFERLTNSIDNFNEKSGNLARAANWLAGALALLAAAQVVVAVLK